MKRIIALLLAASFALPLTMLGGCNTMQGAGKDVERGGEKMEALRKKFKESKLPERNGDQAAG